MKLYEINAAIENCVDHETGEIINQEALDALKMERNEKIENIACWIKDLRAEAEALKNEREALAYREKVAKNKIASLSGYLANQLEGEKFKTPRVLVTYRKSETVEVHDINGVPDEFLIPQPAKLDKVGLKKALKQGAFIAGASIVEHQNIQIK